MTWVATRFILWDVLESKQKRLMIGIFRIMPDDDTGNVQLYQDTGLGSNNLGTFITKESAQIYADIYYRRSARDLIRWRHNVQRNLELRRASSN